MSIVDLYFKRKASTSDKDVIELFSSIVNELDEDSLHIYTDYLLERGEGMGTTLQYGSDGDPYIARELLIEGSPTLTDRGSETAPMISMVPGTRNGYFVWARYESDSLESGEVIMGQEIQGIFDNSTDAQNKYDQLNAENSKAQEYTKHIMLITLENNSDVMGLIGQGFLFSTDEGEADRDYIYDFAFDNEFPQRLLDSDSLEGVGEEFSYSERLSMVHNTLYDIIDQFIESQQ